MSESTEELSARTIAERIVIENLGQAHYVPYHRKLVGAIEKALFEEADKARAGVGRAFIGVADNLLHDPESDGVDGHVSAVLRELGHKLIELKNDDLRMMGLHAIAEEVLADKSPMTPTQGET